MPGFAPRLPDNFLTFGRPRGPAGAARRALVDRASSAVSALRASIPWRKTGNGEQPERRSRHRPPAPLAGPGPRGRESKSAGGLGRRVWSLRERLRPPVFGDPTMAKTQAKVVLSKSQDIPFNQLVLSQANVRRIKTGLSIEELAEDIAPPRPAAKPERPPGARRRRSGNRNLRGSGGRAALSGARTARQAEAPGQEHADPLHRARRGPRRGRQPRRKRPARRAPSARPVPRLQGAGRGRRRRRGHRGALLSDADGGQAAAQAGRRVAEAPRPLRRGRDDARAADVLHRHRRSHTPGAGLGEPRTVLHEGALSHPAAADRRRRACPRQAGALCRRRGL